MRVIDLFDKGVALDPGRTCLVDDDPASTGPSTSFTYDEVFWMSHRIAGSLHDRGIPPGSPIAVCSPNASIAFVCVLGILRAGCAWVGINPRNPPVDNVAMLGHTGCRVAFVDTSATDLLSLLTNGGLTNGGLTSQGSTVGEIVTIDRPWPGATWLGDLLDGERQLAPEPETGDDDPAILFSTGGTTGRAKAVIQTNRVIEAMTACFHLSFPAAEPPVHLVAAPMTHGAGLFCIPLLAGGATTVVQAGVKASAVLEAIERHAVTHLFLPPTAIYSLLDSPDRFRHDYSSLRYFLYGAAPMSVERLKEAIATFGPVMTQAYGQAEAPLFLTVLTPEDHRRGLRDGSRLLWSCGRPPLLSQLAIMDGTGALLGPGERGEIVARGPLVMKGYHRAPEETAAVSTHGWHHTGDVGYRDVDGYFYIVDRNKDMIVSGGVNVYPAEVEQVIWGHPAVADCSVIGVPDPRWGEAVKAVVELKPGRFVDEEELIARCKAALGSTKAPKSVEFRATLPRSPNGKVLRRAIREPYWEGHERRV
jgi:acyl-CoA synthetase (AMP-forming)/AMP-acid ligase II